MWVFCLQGFLNLNYRKNFRAINIALFQISNIKFKTFCEIARSNLTRLSKISNQKPLFISLKNLIA
ncbi:hypothetical protein ATCC51561_702 [Campylobacter concisus ATCC 51561]|nr:hypothetical protein ATCC51561_702 [Campylobacter concisus ATCC 51561]